MASGRVVNTNFWKDSYIIDLNTTEKLLFIYFLTNPRTSLAGIYEISLREVAFDTGLSTDFITHTLAKFSDDNKMYFERNWLILTNFIKHQRLNPSIIRGIEKAIEELPEWLQNKIDLAEDEDNQMSIFVSGHDQSAPNLGTTTPQYKEIKTNIKKLKEKKSKQTAEADEGSKELTPIQKRNYAIAMNKEREQEKRAKEASTRKPSAPSNFDTLRDNVRGRKR